MKSLLSLSVVLMSASLAFAQNEKTSAMSKPTVETGRSSYIANGVIAGLAYDHLDMGIKLKMKNKKTGATYEASGTADTAIDMSGLKLGYAAIPKNGVGFGAHLTALKVNRSSDDGKTYYDLRAGGDVTFATEINPSFAIYGFGGANINHLTDSSSGLISDTGLGIQAGGGIGIGQNLSLEAGYVYIIHPVKESAKSEGDIEYDKNETNISLKGLIARLTYNF